MQAKVVIFQVTERPDYELATRAGPDRPIYVGSKGMAGAATDRAPYIPGSSRIPPAVIGPAIELGVPIYIPGYINWVPFCFLLYYMGLLYWVPSRKLVE